MKLAKPTLALLVPALLVLLQACTSAKSEDTKAMSEAAKIPTNTTVIPVKVEPVAEVTYNPTIEASGQFTTDDESILSFKLSGIVTKILVKEGDAVTTGQLLATLDPTEINAQVEQAKLGLEKARRDLKRAEALYKDSVVTLELLQNARTQVSVLEEQVKTALFNRQYAEIRAVTNGRILRKFINNGQVVSPGTPVLQTNGANASNWTLKVGLSDKDWASLQLGDLAEVTTDAATSKTYKAKVKHLASQADPYTGTLNVELELENVKPTDLAAGLFGKAIIHPSKTVKAYAIPYQALMDGTASTGYVFVAENNLAKKVPVRIGQLDRDRILITDGLKAGDNLITQGSAYLNDGAPIKITQ